MDEIKNMLRGVINAQSAMKQELLAEIKKVDKRVSNVDKKLDGVEERLTKRIDSIGKTVAYLEDDTPTRVEYRKLEKRVTKIEKKLQMQPAI